MNDHQLISSIPNSSTLSAEYPSYRGNDSDSFIGIRPADVEQHYAQNYGLEDIHHGLYGTLSTYLGGVLGFFGSIPCCFICPNPYQRIAQGSVGLISRFGKCYKIVDPGLVQINPITESITRINMTIQITQIPKQDIMTKDNVSISIESVIYWRVVGPYESQFGVNDVLHALVERARTILRNVGGQHTFQDLVENRDAISREIRKAINPVAHKWGVEVEATLVKDIGISRQLQEALSSAAQAKRLGESRVIGSQAEVESAKLMREAADILNTPAAMQIRYLETLSAMSRGGQGPKTIFMPVTNHQHFVANKGK